LEKSKFIPYGRQSITEEDIKSVVNVLKSDFLTQGPVVPVFERKLCDYTGAKYAVAVNSCTSALHIACLALDLGPGDILWTSPITFVASANCALYCGATVDFVDIEPDTALMSVEKLKMKLEQSEKEGKLPKIVIPVHFSGQPCDMKQIYKLGKKYGFYIVEDAAHAIGSYYDNIPTGSCRYSDITVFSFHPVKIITTGEGGATLTNNKILAKKMLLLRSHGITKKNSEISQKLKNPWGYEQILLGYNYRLSDINAALGNSQIDRIDMYIKRRTEIASWYNKKFDSIGIDRLKQLNGRNSSHHLYIIKAPKNSDRGKIYSFLSRKGLGVNIHYMPLYRQPYYNIQNKLLGAEEYYSSCITIPVYPSMSNMDLVNVYSTVKKSFDQFKH
jgi:UDP-4-amino-4,6-dideoxy-N-acetyl-beta-L-altrosamine transaminase